MILVGCATINDVNPVLKFKAIDEQSNDPKWLTVVMPRIDDREKADRQDLKAVVEFIVTKDGKTKSLSILSSNQDERYDNEIHQLVDYMRFVPAKVDGEPIEKEVKYEIQFVYKKF